MAETDKTVAYAIDGNADGFLKAMQQTRTAAAEGAKSVEQAFSQLGGVFKMVQGALGGMLAIFAGGAAFKAAVDATKEWGSETGKLSKQLQITAAEATAYQVAARHLGLEAGALVDASDKMARQLGKNEDAFKTLGIETRNQNGSWRSTGQLLPEVMDKLRGIDNVTQQNIAGQQLFGKGWSELRGLMKLSSAEMENARQKAKSLNLETDPKQVAQYKEAMNDIKLIMTSLSIQVGNALLPVLTSLGKWFGEVGPAVAGAFGTALKVVMTVVNAVWGAIKTVVSAAAGLVAAMVEVIQGNYSTAWGILKDVGKTALENVAAGYDAAADVWKPKPIKSSIEKGDGGPAIDFSKAQQAKDTLVRMWETQLEERKLNLQEQAQAEGRFAEMSKADEQAYWRDKLALTAAGSADQLAVRKKVATLGLEIQKEEYQTQVASLHTQQESYKHNLDARAELLQQEATLVRQKYGEHSKEYEAVQARLTALAREGVAQRLQIEQMAADQRRNLSLAQIDGQRTLAQLELDLGRMTQQQFLAAQRQFEEQRYQIALQGQQERIQLLLNDPDTNAVAIAQTNAQTEALALQHQQRLGEIRAAGVRDQSQAALAISATIEGGLVKVGQAMLTNWRSVGSALRSVMSQIGQTIITEMIIKPLVAKAAAWVKERALKLASVEANAVEAGSGAAASQASIPYVGPILAIAAMAAMLSQVRGTSSSIPSAAGGWEVPHDTLAMVHEKEMILPAKYSDVIRSMAEQPGGPAAGGGDSGLAMRVVPMPGDFWMVHRQDLLRATDRAARDKLRR